MAKCVQQGALDQDFTQDDHALALEFLKGLWRSGKELPVQGLFRSGDRKLPGAGDQIEIHRAPLAFADLLKSKFCRPMLFEELLDMQATMFQPVGGMDRIPYAFARSLGSDRSL
jgi:monoamine oxidase